MNIKQAAEQGIERVRLPVWHNQKAYLRIYIASGLLGPWGRFFGRETQEAIGEPTPQNFLLTGVTCDDFEPYTGAPDVADA